MATQSKARSKSKKRKQPRPMVAIGCTRCPHRSKMTRRGFKASSSRGSGVRCHLCGGNMIEVKYLSP